MTKVDFEYPREKWGEGPWQDEPDRVEFEHAGFPCLIQRSPLGSLSGYVAVPPGHIWHGWMDPNVRVHGGITFASPSTKHICHESAAEDVWWVGFDCAHYQDYTPGLEASLDEVRKGHKAGAIMSKVIEDMKGSYKTIAFVRAECAQLAEQARDLDRLKRGDW